VKSIIDNLKISKEYAGNSLVYLFVLMMINSLFELISIILIIPIIGLVVDPNFNLNHPQIFHLIKQSAEKIFFFSEIALEKKILYFIISSFLVLMLNRFFFSIYFVWKKGQLKYNLTINLGKKIFSKYLNQPYTFHLINNSAKLIRNSTGEVTLFASNVELILSIFTDLILISVLFLFLLFYDFKSTLIIFLLISLLGVFFLAITKKKISQLGIDRLTYNGKALQYAKEAFSGVKDILILGREIFFTKRFIKTLKIISNVEWKRKIYQFLPRQILELFVIILFLIFLSMSIYLDQPFEPLIETMALYLVAAIRIIPGANRLVVGIQSVKFNQPVLLLLQEDLSLENRRNYQKEKLSNHKETQLSFEKNIKIEKINFSYNNSRDSVLENLNLEIKKGTFLGFKGKSGAGKSTLIDLIVGVLKPDSGKILVDKKDINLFDDNWQKKIGYVPQNVFLTDDTLKKNICFGIDDEDINDNLLQNSIKVSELNDLVDSLPNGLNTLVGEKGLQLSGGQRQRIGIARALYHDPEIIIFDESLNSVDLETENKIIHSIKKLKGKKTILLVSHRQSTLDNCEIIYNIENKTVSHLKSE